MLARLCRWSNTMVDASNTARAYRAADVVYHNLIGVTHERRFRKNRSLLRDYGFVEVLLQPAVEEDMFGEPVRCLFRDRLLDLVANGVLEFRGSMREFTVRDVYQMKHVPTRVPVLIYVTRSDDAWTKESQEWDD